MSDKKEQSGLITAWNIERGFGFVRTANGKNHFAHITQWLSDEIPTVGQLVVFEGVNDVKGTRAINVRPIVEAAFAALAGGV